MGEFSKPTTPYNITWRFFSLGQLFLMPGVAGHFCLHEGWKSGKDSRKLKGGWFKWRNTIRSNGIKFHQPRFPWNKGDFPSKRYLLGFLVVWGRTILTRFFLVSTCFNKACININTDLHNGGQNRSFWQKCIWKSKVWYSLESKPAIDERDLRGWTIIYL